MSFPGFLVNLGDMSLAISVHDRAKNASQNCLRTHRGKFQIATSFGYIASSKHIGIYYDNLSYVIYIKPTTVWDMFKRY